MMKPTAEQQIAIDAITSRATKAVVIVAAAGSGKTATLHAAAQELRNTFGRRHRVLVTAFNKDVIRDAEARFGDLAKCKTTHSLAYATHGRLFRTRMDNNPTDNAKSLAAKLGLRGAIALAHGEFSLKTTDAARLIKRTVDRFCSSADSAIGTHHIPMSVHGVPAQIRAEFIDLIVGGACEMWDELQHPAGGKFRFTHDMYRKLWALSQPKLSYDTIMLDEAQDTPPVVEAVFRAQTHALRVAVGDSSQALYEFTGAVDALAKLIESEPSVKVCQLRQSFRFGQKVADLANQWLALPQMDTDMQVVGNPARDSQILDLTQADAVLCRTNAGAFEVAVQSVAAGRKTAIVGNIRALQSLVYGLASLERGQRPRHADLALFETFDDAVEAAKEEDADSDLRVAVNVVAEYGADRVLEIINALVPEDRAELVASTAHKSKGRQWNRVKVHSDFEPKCDKDGNAIPSTRAQGNLAYVAVTRAMLVLDPGPLAFVH